MNAHAHPTFDRRFAFGLAAIALAAAVLRAVFYNGIVGSDDNVYYARALEIASGAWTTANYNGALRYGFNIPVGIALALGGHSTAVANIWPAACSIAEVVLVGLVARDVGGRRVGWIASAFLATTSLHIAVATRIHTDPIVSCFLTAAFSSLWFALRRRDDRLMVLAGVCFGLVFWAKELAAVTYFGALPMLWYFRRRWPSLLWLLAGFTVTLAANFALMWLVSGHPLHGVRVVLGAVSRKFVGASQGEDTALFYFPYLFADIRHVGFLGWLAALGIAGVLHDVRARRSGVAASIARDDDRPGAGYVVLWLSGVLAVLSFFPVSLHPLRLTMKQSNYLTLVLGPLALLAALGVCRLGQRVAALAVAATIMLGVLLGSLQQADLRAFTGNGKALWSYLVEHPSDLVVASRGNDRIAGVRNSEFPQIAPVEVMVPTDPQIADGRSPRLRPGTTRVVAVVDPQTARWLDGGFEGPLACWRERVRLPAADLGLGNRVAGVLFDVARALPGRPGLVARAKLESLAHPKPAVVYDVPGLDLWCKGEATLR